MNSKVVQEARQEAEAVRQAAAAQAKSILAYAESRCDAPRTAGMTQEFVEELWRAVLRGFDGKPVVWQEGDEFVMKAYFLDHREAARFAALLTNLTGAVAEFKTSPRAN